MITAPDIQAMVQKHMFASIPAEARQAYDEANANFRQRLSRTVKTAEKPATEAKANEAQKRAAVVLNLADAMRKARRDRSIVDTAAQDEK
jgi:hypothetical protein